MKKANTKGQILFDSIYIKYLEQANSERESRLEVARGEREGMGDYCLMGRVSVWVMKNSGNR